MRVLGLDLGSRQVKMVVMEDGRIEDKKSWHTAYFYRQFCSPAGEGEGQDSNQLTPGTGQNALGISLEALGVRPVDLCVSTGYGRNNTNLMGFKAINEIKAHALGAKHQTGQRDFVLLDVGGQDVKVMRIQSGQLVDMNLNDKCAASCGRFLEQMASVLDMPLDEMTAETDHPAALSSTCAVFCESELIGKMAEGYSPQRLAAGVNLSLYKRLEPMLSGFEHDQLWLSGGVAGSQALQALLLGRYPRVTVLSDPTFNGAIGCCVYGSQILKEAVHV